MAEEQGWHKPVGITLALLSGAFIGSSFILKKKGLLDAQKKHGEIGSGHSYLSSPLWWIGLLLMALGEICNFGAYAFVPAILVTPLGALSVVISAILSSIFLDEQLNFSGKVGCGMCVLGATIVVLNAPETSSANTMPQFFAYVVAPGFLVYSGVLLFLILYLIYQVSPRYGSKYPIVYISICSMVGSFLVVSIQGFGSSIVYSGSNWNTDNQFRYWTMYLLLAFIIFTVISQIHFLNKSLNLFSTAIVTPVYYVFFTTSTLVTSAVLFQGFPVASVVAGIMLVIGFLVIVSGVALLFEYNSQMNAAKELEKLERRKLGLQSNGSLINGMDGNKSDDDTDDEMFPEDDDFDSDSEDGELLGFVDDDGLISSYERKGKSKTATSSLFNLFGSRKASLTPQHVDISGEATTNDKLTLKLIAESKRNHTIKDQRVMLEEPDILANESQAAVWHTFANSSRKLSFTATIPESEDAMIQQAADPKQAILSSTNQRPPSSMKHSSLETRSIMSASSNPQGRTSQHHAHFAPNTTSAPLVPRGPHTSQIYPRPYPPIIRPPNNSTSQVNWANQPYNAHAMSNTESRPQSRIQSANYSQQPQHSQYIHPPRTPVRPRAVSPNADRFFADLEAKSALMKEPPLNQKPNYDSQHPVYQSQLQSQPQIPRRNSGHSQHTPRQAHQLTNLQYQRQMGYVPSGSMTFRPPAQQRSISTPQGASSVSGLMLPLKPSDK